MKSMNDGPTILVGRDSDSIGKPKRRPIMLLYKASRGKP